MRQNLKVSPKSSGRPQDRWWPELPWDEPCSAPPLGILTSTVYQAAQELCPALVPGAEQRDDGAEVKVGEVAVFDEAVSERWLPAYFAGQQQKHFGPFLFFQ